MNEASIFQLLFVSKLELKLNSIRRGEFLPKLTNFSQNSPLINDFSPQVQRARWSRCEYKKL